MINMLLISNKIDYYRELLNYISIFNSNARICGIANNINEINFINSKQHIDIVLIDFNLYCNDNMIKKFVMSNRKNNNNIIFIINEAFKNNDII